MALLAAAALLLAAAGSARADELKLKDGRVLEGKVLDDSAAGVKFKDRFGGEALYPRDQVASVVRKDLPEEAFAKKRAALDPKDAAGRWTLAQEARDAKLRKAYEELVDEVLRLDPAHEGANLARGNVAFEGKWMKPAERDRLVEERVKAEKGAKGLVEYKGRWVTPEEKDALEKGLVLYEGKWMSEREAKLAQGYVEYKGGWVKREELEATTIRDALIEAAGSTLTVAQSERFTVAAPWNQVDVNLVLQDCEKTYAEFAAIFGVGPKERLFDDPFNKKERRCTIVILDKDLQYQKFLDGLLRFHTDLKKVLSTEKVEHMRRQKGFYLIDPDCWIVGYQFPHPKEMMRHTVVHKLSHVLCFRRHFKGIAWPNWWAVEGLGEMQEVNAFGNCQVFCTTAGYGQTAGQDKWIGESWKAECKKLAMTGGDRKLGQLVVRGLNDLEPWDLVKSWSFVHYLVALDKAKFADLVLLMKGGMTAQDALTKVYGATMEELDDRWREFVRRTY
jgi:hypothetical protein